jgi:hypothetical protein
VGGGERGRLDRVAIFDRDEADSHFPGPPQCPPYIQSTALRILASLTHTNRYGWNNAQRQHIEFNPSSDPSLRPSTSSLALLGTPPLDYVPRFARDSAPRLRPSICEGLRSGHARGMLGIRPRDWRCRFRADSNRRKPWRPWESLMCCRFLRGLRVSSGPSWFNRPWRLSWFVVWLRPPAALGYDRVDCFRASPGFMISALG